MLVLFYFREAANDSKFFSSEAGASSREPLTFEAPDRLLLSTSKQSLRTLSGVDFFTGLGIVDVGYEAYLLLYCLHGRLFKFRFLFCVLAIVTSATITSA